MDIQTFHIGGYTRPSVMSDREYPQLGLRSCDGIEMTGRSKKWTGVEAVHKKHQFHLRETIRAILLT